MAERFVQRNRVYLRKINEPSPLSAHAEVPKHFVPPSDESHAQSLVHEKVTTLTPSQEDALSSGTEVSPAAALSPAKPQGHPTDRFDKLYVRKALSPLRFSKGNFHLELS